MSEPIGEMSPTVVAFQLELLCQRDMEAAAHQCGRAIGSDFEHRLAVYNNATARWLDAVAATHECYRLSCA